MKKFRCLVFIDDDYPTNYYHKIIAREAEIAEDLVFFQSATEALDYLISVNDNDGASPEVIFLDINMPGMNGWEFIKAYEKKVSSQSSKIWMLSTSINPADKALADINERISGFLNKPLTVEIFNELREEYL
ncbi:MAG: response regulator [Bacteroidia bacterium]